MKKGNKIIVFGLMMALTASTVVYASTGPAYPEVPVSERTSNLAENQNFVDWGKIATQDYNMGISACYDMYGNRLTNARLSGGEIITNSEGIIVWNNIAIDGINANMSDMVSSMYTKDSGWRQDLTRPISENGVSNWYHKGNGTIPAHGRWEWLPDENDILSTKKAYCFNEYGYLYVNTITPDGFTVNERGQLITEDGILVEHAYDALTHDSMHSGFMVASIGFMKTKYFSVCEWDYDCKGKCLFGLNKE